MPLPLRKFEAALSPEMDETHYITGADFNAILDAASRFASVTSYGAKGDGVTDDTAAIQAAINAAKAAGGGTVYLPPGEFRANISVTGSGIHIIGSAAGPHYTTWGGMGTVLRPYDLTKPVLTIGDGVTPTGGITVEHLTLRGDSAQTSTSDGLKLNGVEHSQFRNLMIVRFGRDNIWIDDGAAFATEYIDFYGVHSYAAKRSCVHVSQTHRVANPSKSWVAAVYFYGLQGQSLGSSGSTWLWLEGADARFFGGWWQMTVPAAASTPYGHIKLSPGSDGTGVGKLTVFGVQLEAFDSGGQKGVAVEIDYPTHTSEHAHYFVSGEFTCSGLLKWRADGTLVDINPDVGGGLWNKPHVRDPFVTGALAFSNAGLAGDDSEMGTRSPVTLKRTGATGSGLEMLVLSGAGYQTRGTYQSPLAFVHPSSGVASALWQNDTSRRLFVSTATSRPSSDTDGFPVATAGQHTDTFVSPWTPDATYRTSVLLVTSTTAFTVNAPTNAHNGDTITLRFKNTAGGSMGTVTWDTAYKLAAWTSPANGFSRSITFNYNGSNWVEVSRTPSDVPN